MTVKYSLNQLRQKAHEINCDLVEADYDPREIEIIGYYLKRIAASYLSYHTHKEISETDETETELKFRTISERKKTKYL